MNIDMEECNDCQGCGYRLVKIIWDYWERYLWQKSVKACRSCGGRGYK